MSTIQAYLNANQTIFNLSLSKRCLCIFSQCWLFQSDFDCLQSTILEKSFH